MTQARIDPDSAAWFRVEVSDRDGQIVAIETEMLAGRDIGDVERETIQKAIDHLSGFIGGPHPVYLADRIEQLVLDVAENDALIDTLRERVEQLERALADRQWVPSEPTEEMLRAGLLAEHRCRADTPFNTFAVTESIETKRRVYKAMLAAAPPRRLESSEKHAVAEALARAANAVCPHCAAGLFAEFQGDPSPAYWHENYQCRATPIRLLMQSEVTLARSSRSRD